MDFNGSLLVRWESKNVSQEFTLSLLEARRRSLEANQELAKLKPLLTGTKGSPSSIVIF